MTVAFIIPTVGRDTLARALDSVREQSDPDWIAVVTGDGFMPAIAFDARIYPLRAPDAASAGLTRTWAMRNTMLAVSANESFPQVRWLAFLDDDDTVSPHYVERLHAVSDADLVIFRMSHPKLGVLPDTVEPKLGWGHVGISFAVRLAFACAHDLRFIAEQPRGDQPTNEDIEFVRDCNRAGARVLLHPDVSYFVRDHRP